MVQPGSSGEAAIAIRAMAMLPVSIAQLIDAARAGAVVSFPTDTLPALAVRPHHAAEIYRLKGRDSQKPLILMGAKAADLWPYVHAADAAVLAQWKRLAAAHWPGALTLVLPTSGLHDSAMTPADGRSLGIRVPQHAVAQAILAATGPLATTSANHSGEPPLQDLGAIAQQFPRVTVLASSYCGDPPLGQPSTVVAWEQGNWRVLRQGAVWLGQ